MTRVLPITRGRKFAQVLEGARTVFLRDGFEGASVDNIAREAAVSKATLYSYFPDKRLMFIEVFRTEMGHATADIGALINVDLPVDQVLPFIVQMISSHLVSDLGMRVYRVSVGESERFPALAKEYYETGVVHLRSQLIHYLERGIEKGELVIEDTALAADQLIQLSSTIVHDQAIFLGVESVDRELMQRINRGAVRMFMANYAAPDHSATGSNL